MKLSQKDKVATKELKRKCKVQINEHTGTKARQHTLMRGCGAGGVRLDKRTGEGKRWKNTGRRENNTEGGTDKQHATDHDTLSVKVFKHFTYQQDCAAVNRFTLSHYLQQISSFFFFY